MATQEYDVNVINKLHADKAALVEALEVSSRAVDDWLHTYADDMCDADAVAETNRRIGEACGTLAYIADVQQQTRAALTKARKP